MKFSSPGGFNSGEQFYQYLKDAFDVLYAEGETEPKMLSIGMHCRILGRPGRFKALQKFLDYVQGHKKSGFADGVILQRIGINITHQNEKIY